jgi:hypothetical protein
MHGMIRWALIAGILYGCHTDDTDTPDAPVGTSGIKVHWSSQPAQWPGTIDTVQLDRATFRIDSLRVIGDAGPGDPRTTADTIMVEWKDDAQPQDIDFADAPIGLYSQLALMVDGDEFDSGKDAYEIRGRVTVGSNDYELRINDADPLPINLSIDQMLRPGAVTTIDIDIDIGHALTGLDFQTIPLEDGRFEIDQDSTGIIEGFRDKLVESFKTTATTTGVR